MWSDLDPLLEFGFEFAAGDLEFLESQEAKADGDLDDIQEQVRGLGQRVFGLFGHAGVLTCRFPPLRCLSARRFASCLGSDRPAG